MLLYHGSPYSGMSDLRDYEGSLLFLTPSPSVAEHYLVPLPAAGRRPKRSVADQKTLYKIKTKLSDDEVFDTRLHEHQDLYQEIRDTIRKTEDPDDWPSKRLVATPSLPDSTVRVLGHFPDFGAGLSIIPYLKEAGFRAMWVSEGSQGASLALFYPSEDAIIENKENRYRRNADYDIRRMERSQDPSGQARALRAKSRAGQVTELQLHIAACLRHPAATILYPNSVGGPGDGDRPTLDSEGMVVRCAGADQLGRDVLGTINSFVAPLPQSYAFCATMCIYLLDSFRDRFEPQADKLQAFHVIDSTKNYLNDAWDLMDEHYDDVMTENPIGHIVFDNSEVCSSCWEYEGVAELVGGEVVSRCANCSSLLKFESMLNALRVRASFVGSVLLHRYHAVGVDGSILSICDAMLRLASYYYEVATEDDEEYREQYQYLINGALGVVMREVCRLHPDLIDTWGMADAVLNMQS